MKFSFNSNRSSIHSRNGIVASSQPLATAAGIHILGEGGNAVDAALATAAALNVTEPTSTGIGGDVFALYYQAESKKVFALNGSGRAPAALSLTRIKNEGLTELPPLHPYTITIPGACAAWFDLHERFGSLTMDRILSPAITLAEEGFPVAPMTAYFWQRSAQSVLQNALHADELLIHGRGPNPGEIFRNPGLVKTFRLILEQGKAAYYRGEIAEAIVSVVKEAGGCITLSDLDQHHSIWEEPIFINYQDKRIWECPPNGQGLAALLALNVVNQFDLMEFPAGSTERYHLLIEAMRLSFSDAWYFIADPVTHPAPLDWLLSSEYAKERANLINFRRANKSIAHGSPPATSDTVYLAVVDSQGNACSFINSNYMGFGTGIVPEGFGFTLQNRGHNFSLDPNHPNSLAPGKRPYHTIIPALVTDAMTNDLVGPYGVMGGFMQPQGHLQVAVSLFEDKLDPQSALDLPRFCIEPGSQNVQVAMEEGIPLEIMANLASMGHHVRPVTGMGRAIFGRGQVILRNSENGVLSAGSDPRADGCAMTYL